MKSIKTPSFVMDRDWFLVCLVLALVLTSFFVVNYYKSRYDSLIESNWACQDSLVRCERRDCKVCDCLSKEDALLLFCAKNPYSSVPTSGIVYSNECTDITWGDSCENVLNKHKEVSQ